ncbi:MAG TPA: hypothetical protein VIG08_14810 [Gemmatimonadales bacterium]
MPSPWTARRPARPLLRSGPGWVTEGRLEPARVRLPVPGSERAPEQRQVQRLEQLPARAQEPPRQPARAPVRQQWVPRRGQRPVRSRARRPEPPVPGRMPGPSQ